uniref:Uncharacterized protein n=1 Tax=Arundo donax TaxID=35708 RepID=A0A0A9DVC6_ARUDO
MMAWLVMPIILRRLHKYASQSPIAALLGNSTKNDVSYQTSLWCALEDPAKYLITFMAFSEMATLIAYCTKHINLSSTGMEGCICSLFCVVPS